MDAAAARAPPPSSAAAAPMVILASFISYQCIPGLLGLCNAGGDCGAGQYHDWYCWLGACGSPTVGRVPQRKKRTVQVLDGRGNHAIGGARASIADPLLPDALHASAPARRGSLPVPHAKPAADAPAPAPLAPAPALVVAPASECEGTLFTSTPALSLDVASILQSVDALLGRTHERQVPHAVDGFDYDENNNNNDDNNNNNFTPNYTIFERFTGFARLCFVLLDTI
jgi:hypothetical protein